MLNYQPALTATRAVSVASTRKLFSRTFGRLRFAWFILGASFGAAASYYIVSLNHHDSELSGQPDMTRALALLQSKFQPLPAVTAPSLSASSSAATSIVTLPASETPDIMLPASYTLTVKRGDTLSALLQEKGVSAEEAQDAARHIGSVYSRRALMVGQSLEVHLDKSKQDPQKPCISDISLAVSPIKTILLTRRDDDRFAVREVKSPIYKSLARAGGEIRSSLYQTSMSSGLPAQMLPEIIQAFSYDVDFQRDIREGDSIDVVFERIHTDKGVTVGYGKIIYASLTLGDDVYTVYRHVAPDGFANYYNSNGESVRKALLKTPINGARITSGFGMRMHPLLGYSKMHKGIDFGAAVGTPIYAAGDGVIEEAGRKGGYGNYVRIKHSSNYATAYGHASRIARGIHSGIHVKQGQVVAYVGSTGFSTGPHLHYEILINGKQINPSGVKFRTGQTLAGKELNNFRHEIAQVKTALATLPQKTQVAALESH